MTTGLLTDYICIELVAGSMLSRSLIRNRWFVAIIKILLSIGMGLRFVWIVC